MICQPLTVTLTNQMNLNDHVNVANGTIWSDAGNFPEYLFTFYHHVRRGGRKRLPKFKFSAKFPIGLHVILQIQIKKFENDCYLM